MAFIPPNTQSLKTATRSQSRIAIMGYPFTGKTYSALTWPNPVVLDLDNKLGAHIGRDVIVVPFTDPKFIDNLARRNVPADPPNTRDAVLKWLETVAIKLEPDQTLILDSWTMLNQAQEQQERISPEISTRTNQIDERAAWRNKLTYFSNICRALKQLSCDVVITFHEQDDRVKSGMSAGELTGKVRPLMNGQFKDQLMGHFTDFVRQHAFEKPANVNDLLKNQILKRFGPTVPDWMNKMYSDAGSLPTVYAWQTYSDDIADCGTVLKNPPPFMTANYDSWKAYKV